MQDEMQDEMLVVVSAYPGWEDRLSRLARIPRRSVICVSDPADLSRKLSPIPAEAQGSGPVSFSRLVGLILDLCAPPRNVRSLNRAFAETPLKADSLGQEIRLAWCFDALLATAPVLRYQALIVVSYGRHFEAVFRHHGVPLVRQVHPDADDATWRGIFRQILARSPDALQSRRSGSAAGGREAPASTVCFTDRAKIDLDRCMLYQNQGEVALTGQEVLILRVLALYPGRFFTASELAQHLARPPDYPDAHCIEQTIYGLRRKLGETAKGSQALVSRRGLGYALFVQQRSLAVV
ncbi:MAG TPA: winged helix-turn-helix domain-containing protein [Ktedonobacterales bacterium]